MMGEEMKVSDVRMGNTQKPLRITGVKYMVGIKNSLPQ